MKDYLVTLLLVAKLLSQVDGLIGGLGELVDDLAGEFFTFRLQVESYSPPGRLCYGGDVGLTDTSIQVQYRLINGNLAATDWRTLETIDPKIRFDESLDLHPPIFRGVQFRLIQLEHGGGSCNCWRVNELARRRLLFGELDPIGTCFTQNSSRIFCGGIAREARGFVSMTTIRSVGTCPDNSTYQLFTEEERAAFTENCSTKAAKLDVSYTLFVNPTREERGCSGPEGVEEGIEFSMRANTSGVYGPWIPLRLIWRWGDSDMRNDIIDNTTRVRGYDVETHGGALNITTQQVTICREDLLPANVREIQFRWINTAQDSGTNDMWAIVSATANFTTAKGRTVRLFDISDPKLPNWQDLRNGSTTCTGCMETVPCSNNYLTFGGFNLDVDPADLYTKIALTSPLSVPIDIMTPPPSRIISLDTSILSLIQSVPVLEAILTAEPVEAAISLLEVVTNATALIPDPAVALHLLGDILSRAFSSLLSSASASVGQLLQTFVEVLEELIEQLLTSAKDEMLQTDVIGSSLLSLVDRLALELFPTTGNLSLSNLIIQSQLVSAEAGENIPTINSIDFRDDLPLMSIEIPSELVELFANSSGGDDGVVRVISALYYGVEQIFPSGRPGNNDTKLGSGIVSTGLQCGDSYCDSRGTSLENPVIITIQHSKNMGNFEAECVFWEFLTERSALITRGRWSNEGCFKNETLSDASQTVCECNHLTHFAILLSPLPPLDLPDGVALSLTVIGYVGVGISLLAMAATIVTFIFLKSLHNMRNYIHIHLCINLMIAQLIFVAGIDQSAVDHVPVHCQAIAVLLHYFFLVSFMWMLMEGVVLYVVLVLVFAEHTKYYIVAFTLASYGIPLLYLGLLTLPLGFALEDQHYGATYACFLNGTTHFIWAFIAPVIVIIVMTFVLFLIVAKVMWKHQKRRTDKTKIANVSVAAIHTLTLHIFVSCPRSKVSVYLTHTMIILRRRWFRSALFLVLTMGLTWIVGVLVLEVEALLPLAYIFTFVAAFQGLILFLVLVVMSKQVRDAYRKWWNGKVTNSTILSKYFGDNSLSSGHVSNSTKSTDPTKKSSENEKVQDTSFLNKGYAKQNGDNSVEVSNDYHLVA